jgi:hypothetical protein
MQEQASLELLDVAPNLGRTVRRPLFQSVQTEKSESTKVSWDLWWTKRYSGNFCPSTSPSPATFQSANCYTLIRHQVANSGPRTKWT